MRRNRLGRTDIEVSVLCLGTMTWGEQNTEDEAHAQLDRALDAGINFIDCAELYPVPPRAETQGRTEAYIGSWLNARGVRDKVILATKVCGRADC
ncbi:MAG TPA: aldo/keto reductase, partial [Gammaproteobacteria bacterium]